VSGNDLNSRRTQELRPQFSRKKTQWGKSQEGVVDDRGSSRRSHPGTKHLGHGEVKVWFTKQLESKSKDQTGRSWCKRW
jgi:hypothetical protein